MNILIVVSLTVAKMKGFALVLLCAFVAVQARHAVIVRDDTSIESPWVVHLRIAISTSGLLDTAVATLINENWAVTTSSSISDVRFMWARFGLKERDVISPSLVYELGVANMHLHPGFNAATGENNVGLVEIPRGANEDGISSVGLLNPGAALPASGTFCRFGVKDDGSAGDILSCVNVDLSEGEGDSIIANVDASAINDFGAGIVSDNTLVGLLSGEDKFTSVAGYLDWIEETTGVSFSPDSGDADAEDVFRVNFVN